MGIRGSFPVVKAAGE